jgi:hypothetical protein
MNRGDRRELIFIDDADRQRFVDTLGEACAKTGWQVEVASISRTESKRNPSSKTPPRL